MKAANDNDGDGHDNSRALESSLTIGQLHFLSSSQVIGPMCQRKFGRIVNITSGSVKMPLAGLDLSSGARAGLTAFLAGVARSVAPTASPSTISCPALSTPTGCAPT